MSETLGISVWRGGRDGGYQKFEVPHREHQTVLDAVTYIQRHLDPDLSYRFACRVGMCGSCAMTVNGVARWTCRTHVDRVEEDGHLEVAPLRNFPIVKDLVCDMAPFFDKWKDAVGHYVPPEDRREDFVRVDPNSKARQRADFGQECIGCGVCYSSCDVVSWRSDFLGPAALNRAWTQVNDERDDGQRERMLAVMGDAGCHACHSQQSCTVRCPMGLDPASSIAGLKSLAAKAVLKGGV